MSGSIPKVEYITITNIDLTAAHTNTEYVLPGFFDTLVVENLNGSLSIRLNKITSGSIDLSKSKIVNAEFDRFFYTNVAQPYGSVTLQIGAEASFGISQGGVRPATFSLFSAGYVASQVTTAAYVVLGAAMSWLTLDKATIVLRETGAVNAVMYQIQGSMDGTNWVTLVRPSGATVTDQNIGAGGIVYETITDLWPYLQINIIDKIAASHGTVAGLIYYKSLL